MKTWQQQGKRRRRRHLLPHGFGMTAPSTCTVPAHTGDAPVGTSTPAGRSRDSRNRPPAFNAQCLMLIYNQLTTNTIQILSLLNDTRSEPILHRIITKIFKNFTADEPINLTNPINLNPPATLKISNYFHNSIPHHFARCFVI